MLRLPRAVVLTVFAVCASVALSPAAQAATAKGSFAGAVPRMPHTVTPALIEDDPAYVPQVSCDAVAKPGVIRFRNLVLPTYARYGGQDWGMAVSCAAEGMTSEHADGRAWDFALNSRNGTQYAAAQRFLGWLFDPDSAGNEQANARRFGVMYVIYKDRIRSVGGDWEPYLPKQCGPTVKKRNPTVCHENHIHLSFTWNGAMARTTGWTGKVYPTDYGPCVPKGKKVAPRWKKANPTPCAGTQTHGGDGHRPKDPWTPPTPPTTLPGLPGPPVAVPVVTDDPGDCTVLSVTDDGTATCAEDPTDDPGTSEDPGGSGSGAGGDPDDWGAGPP